MKLLLRAQALSLYDYEEFINCETSMMCISMISNEEYDIDPALPPHELQFDCHGSIEFVGQAEVILQGGEIRPSSHGEYSTHNSSGLAIVCCM